MYLCKCGGGAKRGCRDSKESQCGTNAQVVLQKNHLSLRLGPQPWHDACFGLFRMPHASHFALLKRVVALSM